MAKAKDKELKLLLVKVAKKEGPLPLYSAGGGFKITTVDGKEIFTFIEDGEEISVEKWYELYCYQNEEGNWQLHRIGHFLRRINDRLNILI